MGVEGTFHPANWKHSRVETESAVVPSAPQQVMSRACDSARRVSASRKARGCVGTLRLSISLLNEEDHVSVGDEPRPRDVS